MNQYKQDYETMFNELHPADQTHFKALEAELENQFSSEEEKWDILNDMMLQFYKARGKSFQSVFGKDPKNYAVKISNSIRKNGVNYWKTVALLNIYFAFFFVLVITVFNQIVFSYLLLLVPLLTLAMVPLMNRGIKEQSSNKQIKQRISTISFLFIFIVANLLVILSFHQSLSYFVIINMDAALLNMFLIFMFSLLTLISLIFAVTSVSIYSKILFVAIGVYTFSWVCDQLNILPAFSYFMLTYGMFIILPIVLITQFIRGKRSSNT